MTVGLLQTQIQINFTFKSIFSKTSLFIHNPVLIRRLTVSVFHMWNDKLYRHRRERVYITNRRRHKVCRHINALKGNLTSSMLRDNSSEQNRRSFLPLNVFIPGTFPNLEHVLWLLLLTNDTVATGGRMVRSSGMTKKKKKSM